MVVVSPEDLNEDDIGLLDYLSSNSETDIDDEEVFAKRRQLYCEIEPEIPFNSNFPNVVLIAGLPCVTQEKFEKLRGAVSKRIFTEMLQKNIFTPKDDPANSPNGSYPFTINFVQVEKDGTSMIDGVCFVTLKDAFEANKAVQCLRNSGLDSKHPFCVCLLDDFDNITSETNETPLSKDVGLCRVNLRDWICDSLAREQYAYRCGTTTDIMWFDSIDKVPQSAYPQEEKLGSAVCWSPRGSYLVTFHKMGIWLRGDFDFKKKICFAHPGVKYIIFSPNEEYFITWDGTNPQVYNDEAVIVWHLFSGKRIRTFPTPEFTTHSGKVDLGWLWPFFLFSPDSKYLAMQRERDIVIYETSTMLMLKDISPQNAGERPPLSCLVEQFQWSPTDNILSVWISEYHDSPGRLLLLDIPSRQEISSKNVFSVKNVSMCWHPHGDFLALCTVIARKKGKKTKKETTQIEIFRVKDKSIPVDTINLENDRVICLRWELGKNASRFAILTGNDLNSTRSIRFYNVPIKGLKQDTELIASLAVPYAIDTFEWSPAGQYFLTASQGSEGTLIFGCLNESNHVEIIQKATQFELTDIFWDPSGRYVTTAVLVNRGINNYRITSNAGFQIYSFLGRLLYKLQDEKACQFLWRPRPPSLLSPQKVAEIHRKLKEYSKIYDVQDDLRRSARKNAMKQETSGKLALFTQACKEAQEWMKSHPCATEWEAAQREFSEYMDWYDKTITWEEVVDTSRELVKKTTKNISHA